MKVFSICPFRLTHFQLIRKSVPLRQFSVDLSCRCRDDDVKPSSGGGPSNGGKPSNDLLDLADLNFGNPTLPQPPQRTAASTADPWGMPAPQMSAPHPPPTSAAAANNDPWGSVASTAPVQAAPQQQNDPWAAATIQPPPAAAPRTSVSPAFGGASATTTTIPACKY